MELRTIGSSITIGMLDLAAFSKHNGTLLKREKERAGTHYLLQQLLKNQPYKLSYTSFNKPFLEGRSEHISISHSHDKLVIIMNTRENTGIDIELIRDKVKNIQHKFINEEEILYAENNTEKLITIWAAKEAMYKVYGEKELEFRKHLHVEDHTGAEIVGHIRLDHYTKKFRLMSETVKDYKMVYVLNEI